MKTLKVLFVDTETTGLVNLRTSYDDLDVWPHILQLTAVLRECIVSEEGLKLSTTIEEYNSLVKYSGEISEDSIKVHGITKELSEEKGRPIEEVLAKFLEMYSHCDLLCAYSKTFDMKMIKAEMLRLKTSDIPGINTHLRSKVWIDPMYYSTKILRLKNKRGGIKYPTLTELYKFVVDSAGPAVRMHDSWNDVQVLMACTQGLSSQNLLNEKHIDMLIEANK